MQLNNDDIHIYKGEAMSNELKNYRKKALQPMRPYVVGEDLTGVSLSDDDRANGSPKVGDMIAVSKDNPDDQWLVNEEFFLKNYELAE